MIKNNIPTTKSLLQSKGKALSHVLPASFFIPKALYTVYNQTSDSVMDLSIVYENLRVWEVKTYVY